MFKKPLALLGVFLIVVGLGYFVGAGVALYKVQAGYGSLEAFSAAQDVELTYNEDGQLIDRGTVEGGDAIMALLTEDWDFPVVEGKGGLDPDDPIVNSQTEYMYQMATIVYHTMHAEQAVVLTQPQIDRAIESGALAPDGTYEGTVAAYQGEVLEAGVPYAVPIDGRYWTGFDRADVLDGPARDLAWSGTTHALVAELGVGAVTHSALQMGLGIAGLLGGLGVVCMVMGIAFLLHTRKEGRIPDTVPAAFTMDTAPVKGPVPA